MATVLVCEDDASLRAVLRRALEGDGHEVVLTATGAEALRAAGTREPRLVVLDLGLPDADGRDVCLALRAHGLTAPVLMLTALDGVHHKVSGFEAGADDYLTKPFDVPELLVRVGALLRRTPQATSGGDGVLLDPGAHEVARHDQRVALSPTEYRVLARLMASPGRVVRRRELVASGWPLGAQVSENTLDSYVRRLRTKLEEIDCQRISTVRGLGYRWD